MPHGVIRRTCAVKQGTPFAERPPKSPRLALHSIRSNMADDSQHYNAQFRAVLDGLNPQQRQAVEHIEGPVLVVAGPGTGKTHLLGARIGQILLDTDVYAHNVLCLTYTDAAVSAMRRRLLEFIGPEAHKVHIFTFHSFCNKVIQENLDWFQRREIEPITELEKVELIRTMIEDLKPGHPLKPGRSVYQYEGKLRHLFDLMKTENWQVQTVKRAIQSYLQDLPLRDEYRYKRNTKTAKAGDLKEGEIEKETEKMALLSAAVELLPVYTRLMHERQRYDYHDMIQWVLQAFERNSYIRRRYQEQYLYVLIDEFQDTNGAQNEIVRHLADFWTSPNVFAVGDDDQAIYEFQGARLQNILDFYRQFPDVELVVLEENYRSSQRILDGAGALIDRNRLRLVRQLNTLQKRLKASNSEVADSPLVPRIVAYPNPLHEAADIAHQIDTLRHQKTPLHEIAVIYARHKQSELLIQLLESRGIAYHTRRQLDVLAEPIVRNLIDLLRYIRLEYRAPFSGEGRRFELLYMDFWGIPALDAARLSAYWARHNQSLSANGGALPWRELLGDAQHLAAAQVTAVPAVLAMHECLEALMADYRNVRLPVLVERAINSSGLLRHIDAQPHKVALLQTLDTFLRFVSIETQKQPTLDIEGLEGIINQMKQNNLALPLEQTYFSESGVQLVTAHSSKGLEFTHVFVMGCDLKHWEADGSSRFQFALPDTLTRSVSATEDHEEARRRLFYVAITRAKTHLQLSYALANEKGKSQNPSTFVAELQEHTDWPTEKRTLPAEAVYEARRVSLSAKALPAAELLDTETLNELLEGYELSPTGLSLYRRCKLAFYYQMVLQVPAIPTEASLYGQAVHYALEQAFEVMKRHKERKLPDVATVVGFFEAHLKRHEALYSPQGYANRLEQGRQHLAAFYEARREAWFTGDLFCEMHLSKTHIDGVPVKGRIDKVEFRKSYELRVVDYKTGRVEEAQLREPSRSQPDGGDYWRQMVFYKLLLENYQHRGYLVTGGVLEFVDPHKGGLLIHEYLPITKEDTQRVKAQLRAAYEGIMRHEFAEGCGDEHCHWCNFVKRHQNASRYHDALAEQLDDWDE